MPLHPPYKDNEHVHQSNLVHKLSLTWMLVTAIVISTGFFYAPGAYLRWFSIIGVVSVIGGVSLLLNRGGFTKPASYFLPSALFCYITFLAFYRGGTTLSIIGNYMPVILTTGFLLGGRRGVFMALLCIASIFLLAYCETNELLVPPTWIRTPYTRVAALMLPFCMTLAIQYYATDHIRNALRQLNEEMKKRTSIEAQKDQTVYDMGERVKELGRLYHASRIFQDEESSVTDVLRRFTDGLPSGWQYPEIAEVRVCVGNDEFKTPGFKPTPYKQTAEIMTLHNTKCIIEIVYLEEKPEKDEGPFLKEERSMINMLVEMMKTYLDRRESKEALQRSEANLQTIFASTDIAYALVNEKLKVVSFNRTASLFSEAELNRTPQVGDDAHDFFRPERRPELENIMKDVLEGHDVNYESAYVQPGGRSNHYHIRLSPIASKEMRSGFLLSVANITEIKNAENEIRALNESLEKRVEERTRELLDANHELEAFSYTVSHDLQGPLSVINGYGRLLLKQQADRLDEQGRNFLTVINDKVTQMSQLIKDLLDFSKFGKSPLNMKEVNMNKMVQEVVEEIRMANKQLKTTIRTNDLPPALCDESLLKQAWVNLISNAVKYSSKRENPEVEVGWDQREGANVYYVKDNGAGFDMKYADNLFKVFKRLHEAHEFEGTGVGLATVERIISKHQGKIWVYAKPDEGATFYFTLP